MQIKKLPKPFFILFSILGLLVILTILVYRLPLTNPIVKGVATLIPYPAVTVDRTLITVKDYLIEHEALIKYLETTGIKEKPAEDVLQQTILEALVNKAAIRALAAQYSVKIDQKLVEQYYQNVIEAEASEDAFAEELAKTFGWNKAEFKKRIIESIVIALQMSEFVATNEELQTGARAEIEQVYSRLQAGEEVEKEDLGYQKLSELPQEWSVAKDLSVGGVSEILTNDQGYLILAVTDRIEAAEDSQVHLMAVMIPKKTLEDFVVEYLEGAKVRYFVK